jgi:type I site-specific restriction endonuclease
MAAVQAAQALRVEETARRQSQATGGAAKPRCVFDLADYCLFRKNKKRLSA